MNTLKNTIYQITFLYFLLVFSSCENLLIGDKGVEEENIYLNYQTKTSLELPFTEKWYVTNGGRTHEHGRHHFITWGLGQRYAMDLVIHLDGKSYLNDGKTNEDYHCFGKPLYAPAKGKIIQKKNDIEDNVPGELNGDEAAGNYVMIDHFNGEYSVLAHFKKGTIMVEIGDTVVQGQELGKTGNSGNSTEAHLHYHLQNSPDILDSKGLPAMFKNYYADDVFLEEGEPIRDQIIYK